MLSRRSIARRSTRSARRASVLGLALAGVAATLAACGSDGSGGSDDADLVVYVGRNEELLTPLIKQFEEESGLTVEARYGQTPDLTATLLEEGDATPADVFLSQDAGALGLLESKDLLEELPDDLVAEVPAQYASADGDWVGVTGRSRVIAYDTEKYTADQVPDNVEALTDAAWKGDVALAPGNASFQSFVTGFRVAEGDDAARAWLTGMVDNDVRSYDNNLLILDALEEGAVGVGLINHYYWFERAAEVGVDNMRSALKFARAGDPGALVNVTGVGLLSDDPDAVTFARFLLGEKAQTYFAETLFEYPLAAGVAAPEGLPALDSLRGPAIDLSDLSDLEASITMIRDAGLG